MAMLQFESENPRHDDAGLFVVSSFKYRVYDEVV